MADKPEVSMKPTLGLTGLTMNAMALIAPGAFLWLTFVAQGTAGANDAAGASDPLSTLLQTLSGATADPSATAAASAGGTAATGCSSFDSGTMAALISLQGQSATG